MIEVDSLWDLACMHAKSTGHDSFDFAAGARWALECAIAFTKMGEAIASREPFTPALCDECASKTSLSRTEFINVCPCERCGAEGTATAGGGVWVYE